MAISVFRDFEQGTPEWYEVRRGIVTASELDSVLAKGKGTAPSKTRRTYLYKLAGERLTGQPMERYNNGYMERGHAMEDEARAWYELVTGCAVDRVAFIRCDDRQAGASPDGIVGADGLIEIKTKAPHLQLEVLESGVLPSEHVAQVQGLLWITGRSWVDFVSYFTGMPPFKLRVMRDDDFIAKLAVEVADFNAELAAIVAKYQEST